MTKKIWALAVDHAEALCLIIAAAFYIAMVVYMFFISDPMDGVMMNYSVVEKSSRLPLPCEEVSDE